MRAARTPLLAALAVAVAALLAVALLVPRPEGVLAAQQVPEPPLAAGAQDAVYATYPDPAWLADVSAATGIQQRALAAYAGSAMAVNVEHPHCNLTWTTVAGIGWVESQHGTHGGATVDDEGRVLPHILGPALDGGAYGEIRDTDGGALDGDTEWDRAVGPMQFLPQTWAVYGETDGDGDGVGDPHDLDDAALATARYLCLAAAADTADPETWRAAVGSYNHSEEYVDLVARTANEYAAMVAAAAGATAGEGG